MSRGGGCEVAVGDVRVTGGYNVTVTALLLTLLKDVWLRGTVRTSLPSWLAPTVNPVSDSLFTPCSVRCSPNALLPPEVCASGCLSPDVASGDGCLFFY